MRLYMKLEKSH